MSDVMTASIRDQLWHRMRQNLAAFIPEVSENQLLMCCTCGRFLPQEWFDLEHLIPQQALKDDPENVRANPATPANSRARILLLCKKPLKIRDKTVHGNGCNSWKGRHYDRAISMLISAKALEANNCTNTHIIAALNLAYLAIVAEFGYVVTLSPSGLLMREQFFMPRRFHTALPLRSQMLLGGGQITSSDAPIWEKPFTFSFDRPSVCVVGMRNFVVMVPISRDPREPIAVHLRITPTKYKLRPNFQTVFE